MLRRICVLSATLGFAVTFLNPLVAVAQETPPSDAPGAAPLPTPPQPAPAPAPQQPPPTQAYPPAPAQQPPAQQGYPPPPPAQGYPPQQQQQGYPPPGSYDQSGYGQPYQGQPQQSGYPYEPPPPPPEPPPEKAKIPPFSIRADPLSWLLEGRLGLELEVGLWKFISFEMVPIFVVNESPPTMNLRSVDEKVTQESDGLGAMAGSSFGLGFWLGGEPFEGYALRAILTNYGISYKAKSGDTLIDQVDHVERHFYGAFSSYSRWGAFTLGGTFGIGTELNNETRCFNETPTGVVSTTSGCDGELQLKLDPNATKTVNLNTWSHPIQLMFRFSLGISID